MNRLIVVLTVTIAMTHAQTVLSSISFVDLVTTTQLHNNFAGISLSFPQIYDSAMLSPLFQQYIKNSWVYGSTSASWGISLKMQYPVGYKYDCPTLWTTHAPNSTCTVDVNAHYTAIGTFLSNSANHYNGLSVGFDREGLDLTNVLVVDDIMYWSNLYTDFAFGIGSIGGSTPYFELFDQVDTYNALNIAPTNYTPAVFLAEASQVFWSAPAFPLGPGLTEQAGPEYMDIYNAFPSIDKFTVYATPFGSQALTPTIIFNQIHYQQYLTNRFQGTTGPIVPISSLPIVITDLRMTNNSGQDNLTNTMVSAIWALDFMLQSARFDISQVLLHTDISNASLEGPFGPAPDYAPQPTYYALLLMSIIQQDTLTYFINSQQLSGTSPNIKVHAFYSQSTSVISLVILNKDPNPTAVNGYVLLNSTGTTQMNCIYMSASALDSKNLTLGGYYFIGGTATPQGAYTSFTITNNGQGYSIPLAHAEVAYCRILSHTLSIPKYSLTLHNHHLTLTLLSLLFLALWL